MQFANTMTALRTFNMKLFPARTSTYRMIAVFLFSDVIGQEILEGVGLLGAAAAALLDISSIIFNKQSVRYGNSTY